MQMKKIKILKALEQFINYYLKINLIERIVISFGGGITGDVAGFAASTFKRIKIY